MPLSDLSGGEISSRHLPDISETCSNTSFSFQIQGTSDNLLADEDPDEFFRNAGTPDISMAVVNSSVPHGVSVDDTLLSKDPKTAQDFLKGMLKDEVTMRGSNLPSSNRGKQRDFDSSTPSPIPTTDSTPVVEACPRSNISHTRPRVVDHSSDVSAPTTIQPAQDDFRNRELRPIQEKAQKSGNNQVKGKLEPELEGQKKPSLRKQNTIQRGITKSRTKKSTTTRSVSGFTVMSALTRDAPVLISKVQDPETRNLVVAQREDPLPDISSSSSMPPLAGVAARLMEYGQKYMQPFSEQPDIENLPPEDLAHNRQKGVEVPNTDDQVNQDADVSEDDRDKPLTLSQLSPRKMPTGQNSPEILSNTNLDVLPTAKPSKKRPRTLEAPSEDHQHKKRKHPELKAEGRTHTISKKEPSVKPRLPSSRLQTHVAKSRSHSSTLTTTSGSSSGSKRPAREIRNPKRVVSQPAIFSPGTGWNDDVRLPEEKEMSRANSNSTSSFNLHSRIRRDKDKEGSVLFPSSSAFNDQSLMSRSDLENRVPEPHNETDEASRPQSHSVARSQKHRFYHPVPDFKAMHAAFDASLAHRKENIHPVVPLSIQFETDMRMQERKKFDKRIKEKFREKEQEQEQERRVRQEQEEKEIKELRKKLVIKAHEVPEWYKTVPKTKKIQEQLEN